MLTIAACVDKRVAGSPPIDVRVVVPRYPCPERPNGSESAMLAIAACVELAAVIALTGSVAACTGGCSRDEKPAPESPPASDGIQPAKPALESPPVADGIQPAKAAPELPPAAESIQLEGMEDPYRITEAVKNHVARLLSRARPRTELEKAVVLYRSVIPTSSSFRLHDRQYQGYGREQGGLQVPFGDDSSVPLRRKHGSLLPEEIIAAPQGQRVADCLEYGFLLIALLRAAGIEARLGERPDHAFAVALLAGAPHCLDAANLAFERCDEVGEPDRVGIARHYSNEGVIRKEQGRLDQALRSLDTAVALRPDHAEALVNRGLVFREQGKLARAIEDYDRALGIDPGDARAWSNKGVALAGQGKIEQAMACYDRALALEPKYHKPWNNKGALHFRGGKLDQAIQCYDRALALKPDYTKAWYNRGLALRARGDLDGAVGCFERALELEPGKGEAWFGKGVALERQGKRRQARECYHQAEALGFSATEE